MWNNIDIYYREIECIKQQQQQPFYGYYTGENSTCVTDHPVLAGNPS